MRNRAKAYAQRQLYEVYAFLLQNWRIALKRMRSGSFSALRAAAVETRAFVPKKHQSNKASEITA